MVKNSGVTVADRDSYVRYVTNGNILTYDGDRSENGVDDATNPESDEKLQQEQVNMQNTWLCPEPQDDYQCGPFEYRCQR